MSSLAYECPHCGEVALRLRPEAQYAGVLNPQCQRLVGILIRAAPHPMTSDQLCEIMGKSDAYIRQLVWMVRQRLGTDAIETVGWCVGYRWGHRQDVGGSDRAYRADPHPASEDGSGGM